MKLVSILSFTIAIWLGQATLTAAQQVPCVFEGIAHLQPNTTMAVGPNLQNAAATIPGLVDVILAARDAWDVTEAANRLGDWNGVISGSDCPTGQPLQLGAFDFFNVSCPTVDVYQAYTDLAFVDVFFACVGCGTRSMSVNTAFAYSFNPAPGQYDLQSVMAHEFGHMLGLRHMLGAGCTEEPGSPCSSDGNRNTMTSNIFDGETCTRDLSGIDIANANAFY